MVSAMVFNVLRNGKIRRAESEVRAIGLAAEEYYRVFREVPLSTNWYNPTGSSDCGYTGTTNNYPMAAEFYNRLSGANGLQQDFLKIARTAENSVTGVLLDPWGSPYEFYLDSNYDGRVAGPVSFSRSITVFVRCIGPNRVADNPGRSGGNDDVTYPALAELIW
jgi:hypothetical protein